MKPQELIERGGLLFGQRAAVTTLWQEIAENFYPQRADFTLTRYIGEEFANRLYSSYPLLVHRDLSNSFAAMLRPRRKDWFAVSVDDSESLSKGAVEWLEFATKRQKQAMYDTKAHFIRATTEGDADFAAFGQCCLTREINWNVAKPHLLYRSWHLRDVAWAEKADGAIGEIYVKWKPTIKQLKEMFPKEGQLHQTLSQKHGSQTLQTTECMRLAVSTDVYRGQNDAFASYPWVMVYLDVLNNHIMDEQGLMSSGFILPRWQTVSGSQYAYSPATIAGLPDARLLQAMTLTLLEAGEMSVRPPMIATMDAIRGDLQLYSGGVTWASVEYDERKGDVLRPITQDRRGLPIGYNVHDNQQAMLAEAFYINKLTLPPPEGDMTAFEVGQRVEEYVRAALPLFEPMEHEYNGQLCEDTFDALLRAGHFGSVLDIPEELRGRDVHFKFISPLHEAIERKEASVFMEAADLMERGIQIDPTVLAHWDAGMSIRDALSGIGLKEERLRSLEQVDELIEQAESMVDAQQTAELAKTTGAAAKDLAKADATAV